jgi:hypothetical protein
MRFRPNRKVLAGAIAVLSTLGLAVTAMPAAHADPVERTSYYGVGSDTTQAVVDALAGAEPYPSWKVATPANIFYTPVHSSVASGQRTLSSFDAVEQGDGINAGTAASCISTKPGGPLFDRPNGSGNGVLALRASFGKAPSPNTSGFQATANSCTGAVVNIPGQVDFARSSSKPSATATTDFTWIPFARDAVSYAVAFKGTIDSSVYTLSTGQLTSLYTNGTITSGGTTVRACLPQSGSGTRKFWVGAVGVSDGTASAAANSAASGCGDTIEEHHGDAFNTKAQSILGNNEAAVFPFSVAQWIGQANHTMNDVSGAARTAGVDLGDIDNVSAGPHPYTGTAPNLVADQAFYFHSSGGTIGTFGRDVYNVLRTSKLSGPTGDAGLISLFSGSSSAVCAATSTITALGFVNLDGVSPHTACGDTSLTGSG